MKAFRVRIFVGAVLAVGALALSGCGGGPSCTDKGKCANDTQTIGAGLQAFGLNCQTLLDGACGSQIKDLISCDEDSEVCDANGNGSIASTACTSQSSALTACCQQNQSACQ